MKNLRTITILTGGGISNSKVITLFFAVAFFSTVYSEDSVAYSMPSAAEISHGNWMYSYELLLIAGQDSLTDLLRQSTIDYINVSDFQLDIHRLDGTYFFERKKNQDISRLINAVFILYSRDSLVINALKKRNMDSSLKPDGFYNLARILFQIDSTYAINWVLNNANDVEHSKEFTVAIGVMKSGAICHKGLIDAFEKVSEMTPYDNWKFHIDHVVRRYYKAIYPVYSRSTQDSIAIDLLNPDMVLRIIDYYLSKEDFQQSLKLLNQQLLNYNKKRSYELLYSDYSKFINDVLFYQKNGTVQNVNLRHWGMLFLEDVYTPNIYRYIRKMYSEYQKKSNNESK